MKMKVLLLALSLASACFAEYNITCFDAATQPGDLPPAPHVRDCYYASKAITRVIITTGPILFSKEINIMAPIIHLPLIGKANSHGGPLGCEIALDLRNGYRHANLDGIDILGAVSSMFAQCMDTEGQGEPAMHAGRALIGNEMKAIITVQGVDIPPTSLGENITSF